MTIPIANPLTPKDVSPNSKVTPPCFSGQQKFPRFTISSKVTLKFPPEVAANTCTGARLNRAQFSSILTSQRSPTSCVHSTEEDRRRPPECHLPNPATLLRVCLTGWIGRRGRRDNFKMKTMKSTYIALFGVLLLVGGSFTVWAQAAQPPPLRASLTPAPPRRPRKRRRRMRALPARRQRRIRPRRLQRKRVRRKRPVPRTPAPPPRPRLPQALPPQRKQPLSRRLPQTALAWSGSTRTPVSITSPAPAGMERRNRAST